MPFDGSPVIQAPKQSGGTSADLVGFVDQAQLAFLRPRLMLFDDASHRSKSLASTLSVLERARDLLADEHHWCKRAFARTWFGPPVRVRSGMARRYCALGAVMRAGYELRLRIEDACVALEVQTGRDLQHWNDEPARTHAEVIAVFDSARIAVKGGA
jgi:hypothetical protein